MRLWHYKLIPFLPDKQLRGQWSELNDIFSNQKNHILINYVYEYPKDDLFIYSAMIVEEMHKRGYAIKFSENFNNYFGLDMYKRPCDYTPFKRHHNNRYLQQCFYNLQEKFDRCQKDFSEEQFKQLEKFVIKELFKTWANHTPNKDIKTEDKNE